jgi:hypothetical protein
VSREYAEALLPIGPRRGLDRVARGHGDGVRLAALFWDVWRDGMVEGGEEPARA